MKNSALFGVVSSLWLEIGAQRRHCNDLIKALPNESGAGAAKTQ
jgi:hypothetical protein